MNGAKFGLGNIQFSCDGENWKQLGDTQEIELKVEEQDNDFYDFVKDINKPIEFSCTLHKNKNGAYIERCLYYMSSKKRRIRFSFTFRY